MVAPKRVALAEANKKLGEASKKLSTICARVKDLQDRVASLEDSLMKVSSNKMLPKEPHFVVIVNYIFYRYKHVCL